MDVLTTTRRVVFDLIEPTTWVPTYLFLPQEANEVPCIVVGRPDLDEGEQRAIAEITVPVYAIGRTAASRDNDSQAELDALADFLINLMWKPPRIDGPTLRMTRMRAVVVPIAATEFPAYQGTVVASTTFC